MLRSLRLSGSLKSVRDFNCHQHGSISVSTSRTKSSAVDGTISKDFDNDYSKAMPFSSIPGPRGLPLIGSWLDYKLHPEKIHRRDLYLKQLREQYGDVVKEVFSGKTIIHLFNIDHIKQVYETEGKYPFIPPLLPMVQSFRKNRDIADGLGFSNGDKWYRLRTVVQRVMLRPQRALDYLPLQNQVADDFVATLAQILGDDGEVRNLNQWVARWGLESAANNCFDLRMGFLGEEGAQVAKKIISSNRGVFELSTKLWFSLPFYRLFPTPSYKQFFKHEDHIQSESIRLLSVATDKYEKLKEEGKLSEKEFLFLSYMLKNDSVTEQDLWAVIISVLTDTLSTTTQALLFNLYTMASNPHVQELAYQEAMTVLPESGELTANGFNSCKYLKACIKETFRFYPVGLDVQRHNLSDMIIGGYQIPAQTYLNLGNYINSKDPQFISSPELFDPNRWIGEEAGKEKATPYLMIPFSIGTRMCAGRRFAEQELVMLLGKILRHFKLEWHGEELNQRFLILQVPDRELRVKFIPRH